MKVTITKLAPPPPAFTPIEVVIRVETLDEKNKLFAFAGFDATIPEALQLSGVVDLAPFAAQFLRAIRVAMGNAR